MGKKKQPQGAANQSAAPSEVNVEFVVPCFRYKGVEYKSADVEKAAAAGDQEALTLIATLVQMGSGVVAVKE